MAPQALQHHGPPGLTSASFIMVWEMFDRDGAGGFQICGVDGDALGDAPLAHLPIGCEVTVEASSASPAALHATEQDLERITATLSGRIVATSRTRTTLTTLVYLSRDDDASRYSTVVLSRGASVSVAPAIDPRWTLFEQARPSGIEEQSMLDFRVRSQLHEAGDIGGVRPIEHVVTGIAADQVAAFTSAVESVGVEVRAVIGRAELTHQADPKDVTEASWTIRLIAERFGGGYDGWECAVLRDEQRPSSRSRQHRRWFRRS